MGSLTEQFFQAGLITKQEKDQRIADEQQQEKREIGQNFAKLSTKSNRPVHFDRLKSCGSVGEFKDTAKKLLIEQPNHIAEVIKLAHRFKEANGGEKLVWLLYQIRDLLPKVKQKNRKKFLNRALRKSGATIELPK